MNVSLEDATRIFIGNDGMEYAEFETWDEHSGTEGYVYLPTCLFTRMEDEEE